MFDKAKTAAAETKTIKKTIKKTDAQTEWAKSTVAKPYRSPVKSHDIFPIFNTKGWSRWGIRCHHSLKDITHPDYLQKGINTLKVGDEVEIQTTNKEEFARLTYIITDVNQDEHRVTYHEFNRLHLPAKAIKKD